MQHIQPGSGLGGKPVSIGLTGSGLNIKAWTQMIDDTIHIPTEITDASSERRGAAMFCAVALGTYKDIEDATAGLVKVDRLIEPNPLRQSVYEDFLQAWTEFSDATRSLDKP